METFNDKNLKPLDEVKVRGQDATVLEVKKNKARVQLDDATGTKLTVPVAECVTSTGLGGRRTGAGRPRKPDKDDYVQITCFLRRDTVAALKAGAFGTAQHGRFGKFLQDHLDRYPLPSNAEYLRMRRMAKGEPVSMGPSPLLIRKEVNKFLRAQKLMEQKKIAARMRRMAKKHA